MTVVALNVTDVPAQISPEGLAAMLTLTGRFGLTVIVIAFDVAGLPVGQMAFELRIHVMMSPLTGEYVKERAVAPASILLTFHW